MECHRVDSCQVLPFRRILDLHSQSVPLEHRWAPKPWLVRQTKIFCSFSCVINSDSDLDFVDQSPISLLFWLLFHFNSYSLALPLHFRFVSTIFSFVQNLVFVHI
jgi:hypothetical protein